MSEKKLAPVVLFVYKRLHHTVEAVRSLQQCHLADESRLFIFSDGAKNEMDREGVAKVREYLDTIQGFAQVCITKRESNIGLAENVIQGVSEIINQYGKAIVIEDDLIFSPYFLTFMNGALDAYEDNPAIFSVSGYNPAMKFPPYYKEQVYLNYRNTSWGWGTWADRWAKVDWAVQDFDQFINKKAIQKQFNRGGEDLNGMLIKQMNGKLNSWSIRFTYAHFKNDAYSVCPIKSLVLNHGTDGSGTHSGRTDQYHVVLDRNFGDISFSNHLEVEEDIMKEFRKFYRLSLKKKLKRVLFSAAKL